MDVIIIFIVAAVERDIEVLGRPLENILHQYITYVKPAFEEFCLPTKKYADVIIPRGADNTGWCEVIVYLSCHPLCSAVRLQKLFLCKVNVMKVFLY